MKGEFDDHDKNISVLCDLLMPERFAPKIWPVLLRGNLPGVQYHRGCSDTLQLRLLRIRTIPFERGSILRLMHHGSL